MPCHFARGIVFEYGKMRGSFVNVVVHSFVRVVSCTVDEYFLHLLVFGRACIGIEAFPLVNHTREDQEITCFYVKLMYIL